MQHRADDVGVLDVLGADAGLDPGRLDPIFALAGRFGGAGRVWIDHQRGYEAVGGGDGTSAATG